MGGGGRVEGSNWQSWGNAEAGWAAAARQRAGCSKDWCASVHKFMQTVKTGN
jgi:hypothetical protein